MTEIKDRLLEVLKARDMTASELSKKSGIGKGSISKYLSGAVIPKRSAIGSMAKVLGVSPAWLMGYDAPMINCKIEFDRLSDVNKEKLMAYYQALIDTQGD